MNFYKHHIGDYAQATSHLSFVEDAAFSRMLRKYYAEEAPLPVDVKAVQRLIGARSRDERNAVQVVLDEFFELHEDGWHNKRADEELAKANAQADTNRQIAADREAKRRARIEHESSARSLNGSSNDSLPSREPSQTPDTRLQTPVEEISNLPVAPARPSAEPLALVPPAPPKAGPPDCPHLDLLALWAEVLPAMPQHDPERWRGAKADHLRVRWRETAIAKRWPDKAAGLDYFRKLFRYVGQSQFLTGRAPPSAPGKRPFVIELEWLVNLANWDKVHEGKYHPEQAA